MVCVESVREQSNPNTDNVLVVPEMKLSPNVGSDRSWVWNAAADVSEGEPEAQTLAIRFANSESKFFFATSSPKNLANIDRRKPLQGSFHQGSARERGSFRQGLNNAIWSFDSIHKT